MAHLGLVNDLLNLATQIFIGNHLVAISSEITAETDASGGDFKGRL